MKTSLWTPYISDHIVNAICWTLVNSLWIGLAIAVLAGSVISLTRKASAMLRYQLLCGLLMAFVVAAGVTFYLEVRSPEVAQQAHRITGITIAKNVYVVGVSPNTSSESNFFGKTVTLLNQNANLIVMVWLLFFVLKSLKMISGLLYIQRIRNYRVHPVSEDLKHKIDLFSRQIGIGSAISLMQSELVKVPVAVGWLKPVILVPMGIIFQLSPEQLDSILWHELAHIYRRDYLVNILQGIVETVFFFNPGLLWLSSLIRAEREACCDDMVLSRTSQKVDYLEALLSFGSENDANTRLAMSIGSGSQLRDRLRRMVSQENKRLSIAEKLVLAVGLVLLSAFTTISKDNPVIKHLIIKFTDRSGKVVIKPMKVSMHVLPEGQRVNDRKPGTRKKDTIIVADTAIRFTGILFKNSDADPNNSEIRAEDDKGNKYYFMVVGGKIASMEINGDKISEKDLPSYQYMIRHINAELAEKKRLRAGDMDAVAKFQEDKLRSLDKMKDLSDDYKGDTVKLAKLKKKFYADMMPPEKFKALQKMRHDDSDRYEMQLARVKGVIADLVAEKVVTTASDVKWFGLTDDEFNLNGHRMSNDMHQRYKAKYGVHKDYGLYYGPVQIQGRGVFIDSTAPYVAAPRGPRSPMPPPSYKFQFEQRKLMLLKQQKALESDRAMLKHQRMGLQHLFADITQDLVSNNILKDTSDLQSFNLTNSSLIVNGKKQPEDVHQKLKEKYINELYLKDGAYQPEKKFVEDPNFGLHYNPKTGSMGVGITNDGGND